MTKSEWTVEDEKGYSAFIQKIGESNCETPDDCIGAVEFPKDACLGSDRDYVVEGAAGIDALRAKPAMLAEGLADHAIPPGLAIADFEALWPGRPVVRLPGVGHFCQEDAPATLVALIAQFMQSA